MAKRIGTGALAETSLYRLRWLAENWRGMGPQRAAGGDCFCSSQYGHGDRYALPSHSEPQTRRRACPYCPGLHSSPRTAETTLIVRLVQNSALTSVTAVRSRPSPALEQFYKQVRSRTPELVRFSRVSAVRRAPPHPNETLCLRSSPDATVPASAPRFELVLQNCRARWSGIRARVLPLGGLQSVARIGSQTTSTRAFRFGYRARIYTAAEDPRRQAAQVGDNRSTIRRASVSRSKAAANSCKSAFESTARGSWPAGTEDGPHRYTTVRSKTNTITAIMIARFFISRTDSQ